MDLADGTLKSLSRPASAVFEIGFFCRPHSAQARSSSATSPLTMSALCIRSRPPKRSRRSESSWTFTSSSETRLALVSSLAAFRARSGQSPASASAIANKGRQLSAVRRESPARSTGPPAARGKYLGPPREPPGEVGPRVLEGVDLGQRREVVAVGRALELDDDAAGPGGRLEALDADPRQRLRGPGGEDAWLLRRALAVHADHEREVADVPRVDDPGDPLVVADERVNLVDDQGELVGFDQVIDRGAADIGSRQRRAGEPAHQRQQVGLAALGQRRGDEQERRYPRRVEHPREEDPEGDGHRLLLGENDVALDGPLDLLRQRSALDGLVRRLGAVQDPLDGAPFDFLVLDGEREPQLTARERRHVGERPALGEEVVDAELASVLGGGQVDKGDLGS